MLAPYRVLDLTDHRGELTGRLFADLGADVIRVEGPSGSGARRRGPRLPGVPDADASLSFAAYNAGKRSVVVDLAQPAERDFFLALAAGADFVLESAPPSPLDAHDAGFERLRAANPRIVHVQITPFGSDGPRAGLPASDLTIAALGGPVSLQGVSERAPVRVSAPQVWRHAGAEALVAALTAHARMLRSGEAQQVDVSAQCAMTWTMLGGMNAAPVQGHDFERQGSMLQIGPITLPVIFPCKDGYVAFAPTGAQIPHTIRWLVESGHVDPAWADADWSNYELRLITGQPVPAQPDEMRSAFVAFLAGQTKAGLFQRGLDDGVTVAPVNDGNDLLGLEHLEARGFWNEAVLPGGQRVRAPGSWIHSSATRLRTDLQAPGLDAHGETIRAEVASRPRSPAPAPPASGGGLPFEGLKVADLSWVGVGPGTTRYLADHGATVVRVESAARPDAIRGAAPFKDGAGGLDRSQFYADYNASKLGLALDFRQAESIPIAKRLIAWADVYTESFTPGTVDKLGIGYDVARALNPEIIMASTCLMGQTGPAATLAGFGYHAGAIAGFTEVTGWPDLPPDGPWFAYTDTVAPRFLAATLMAALDHRRRTGEGQHIDASQLEISLHFLAPELLDAQSTGRVASRLGNRAADAAPEGVYPCAGDDQWCAIAVETDAQWRALRTALGDPAWAADPSLDKTAGRLARHDAIDDALTAWTRTRKPAEVMETLCRAGVPAGAVQRSSDLVNDPQYAHRGFHRTLDHAEMGRVPYAGHQFRIAGYASGPRSAAPVLGQHSLEVMTEILGMSEEEAGEAFASGAIG